MSVDPGSTIGRHEEIHGLPSDLGPEARPMEVSFAQRLTLMRVQIAVPAGTKRS